MIKAAHGGGCGSRCKGAEKREMGDSGVREREKDWVIVGEEEM
jgi:hypothetical protein